MKGHFRLAIASMLLVLVSSAESLSNDGRSECEDGMVYKLTGSESGSANEKCVQKVGGTCRVVRTIRWDKYFPCTSNAYCDENNVCTCENGYYKTIDGHCAKKLGIDSNCTSDQQCGREKISWSQLVCDNGKCTCDPLKSVYATVQRHALDPVYQILSKLCAPLPNRNCFRGFCAPGAQCSAWYHPVLMLYSDRDIWRNSAWCKCVSPFMLNPQTLQCHSPYNQSCSSNIPCVEGLVCSDEGLCGCKSGYVQNAQDSCVGEFGASCKQDRDCDQSRNDLVCDGGFCICKPGLKISLTTDLCSLGYNFSCQVSYPCHDKMECKNGFCRCIDGRHFDRIEDECLQSVGEACNYRNDCGTNADCQNKTCRCNDGYVATPSGACAADFGTACQSDDDCSQTTNALICKNGTCACEDDHEMSPTTKLCSLEHGALCDGSVPCFEELICNGLCSCPEGQYFSGKNCLSFAGHSCDNATGCISNADCFNETCVCKKGYVQTSEGLCDPGFGSPCLFSGDCDQSTNQICNDSGVCDCLPGFKMFSETGQCSLGFRDSCNNSISCGGNLVCKRKKCQCELASQIFTAASNRCLHRVGGPCIETSDCIDGTFCDPSYHSSSQNVSRCNCPLGTVETKDRRCINNTGTDCRKDSDCDTAAGLECTNFQCRCSTNAIYAPESRMCLGYVGTPCFPEPLPYYTRKILLRAVEACIPNAVCGKRKRSTSHECLCDGPRFIEESINRTCVRSPNYQEDDQLPSTSLTSGTSGSTATTTPTSRFFTLREAMMTSTASSSAPEESSTETEPSTITFSTTQPSTSDFSSSMPTEATEELDPDEFPDEPSEGTISKAASTTAPSMNPTTTKHPLGLGELVEYI